MHFIWVLSYSSQQPVSLSQTCSQHHSPIQGRCVFWIWNYWNALFSTQKCKVKCTMCPAPMPCLVFITIYSAAKCKLNKSTYNACVRVWNTYRSSTGFLSYNTSTALGLYSQAVEKILLSLLLCSLILYHSPVRLKWHFLYKAAKFSFLRLRIVLPL